jgi:hypothetical protein
MFFLANTISALIKKPTQLKTLHFIGEDANISFVNAAIAYIT